MDQLRKKIFDLSRLTLPISWRLFISWRVLLFLVSLLATVLVPYRPEFLFTSLAYENPWVANHWLAFLWSWANFDGVLHLHNAASSLLTEPRFLPLLPLLIKIVSSAFLLKSSLSGQVWVGLIITHTASIVCLCWLYKLLRLDYSVEISQRALWFLILFPTSFFLVALYAESLFLALAVGVMMAARRGQWWLSFAAVGLASVTRLPGILLLLPIAWEWWSWCRHKKQPLVTWQSAAQFGLALLPLMLLTMSHAITFNDPLKFIHAQGELANSRTTTGIVLPPIVFWRYTKILFSLSPNVFEWWVAVLELGSGLLAVAIVYWSWKIKLRFSYQLYSLVMIALPFLSGTLSGFPRYIVMVFPMFLVLAYLPKWWRWGILAGFSILQVILVMLFIRGYFVA